MTIVSWKEYVEYSILDFRRKYIFLSQDEKEAASSDIISKFVLYKPCQIVVMSFEKDFRKFLVILHNNKYPDMETIILEDLPIVAFSLKTLNEIGVMKSLGRGEVEKIFAQIREFIPAGFPISSWGWIPFRETVLCVFKEDPRFLLGPLSSLVLWVIQARAGTKGEREKIGKTVDKIRKDAEEIGATELKTRIIESTKKLENEIEQLNKKFDEEIGGVRKMIGTTKDYQDFRVFATDVDDLKKSHVHRDVFDSEIKRLDERINSLKEIKFWSKRAIVDMALAAVAIASTIVAALLAAHII
jgi:hypothetical protein